MAIKYIGDAWKSHLQTGFPQDHRVYLDFRQKQYPPIAGTPTFSLIKDNYVDHSLCNDAANPPHVTGQSPQAVTNGTFALNAAAIDGYACYKLLANGVGDCAAWLGTESTSGMWGFVQGDSLTFTIDVWRPSVTANNEYYLLLADYHAAAWDYSVNLSTPIQDAWQTISVTRHIDPAATGVEAWMKLNGPDADDYVYVKNLIISKGNQPGSHNMICGYAIYLCP